MKESKSDAAQAASRQERAKMKKEAQQGRSLYQCVNVSVCQCVNSIKTCQYLNVSLCQCVSMPMCQYANVSVCQYVTIKTCQYVNMSV